jgi:hypothetical protein
MADEVILLPIGPDEDRFEQIIGEFAARTGLESSPVEGGGARFPVAGVEHAVPVVQTLSEIDPDWSEHLALGDPAAR